MSNRVRSVPLGFSSRFEEGEVLDTYTDPLGEVWCLVQWDGGRLDDKPKMLGRDVEPIG